MRCMWIGEDSEAMGKSKLLRAQHGVNENYKSRNDRKSSVKGETERWVQRTVGGGERWGRATEQEVDGWQKWWDGEM